MAKITNNSKTKLTTFILEAKKAQSAEIANLREFLSEEDFKAVVAGQQTELDKKIKEEKAARTRTWEADKAYRAEIAAAKAAELKEFQEQAEAMEFAKEAAAYSADLYADLAFEDVEINKEDYN